MNVKPNSRIFFDKITILGVGLLGGSFALAMKKNGLCRYITGYGRSVENLMRARDRGLIDSFDPDPAGACKDSDLIMLSTPVGSFIDLTRRCLPAFKRGAIVTDTGSVKGGLVLDMEKLMPEGVYYIGAHPIAGSDRSGLDYSNDGLFQKAKCIVTPTGHSNAAALKTIIDLWRALGSDVITLGPDRHDRIYAAVSHLPHLIAYAIVNTVAEIDSSYLEFGGRGFKDITRIASSSHELWRDICLLNRGNLIEVISVFQKNLDSLRRYLRASDSASLEGEFEKARTLREGLGQD